MELREVERWLSPVLGYDTWLPTRLSINFTNPDIFVTYWKI
jgi:hypothetical protein